jgi:hypothetical protein
LDYGHVENKFKIYQEFPEISGLSVDGAETSMLRIWNMARDWTWMKQ